MHLWAPVTGTFAAAARVLSRGTILSVPVFGELARKLKLAATGQFNTRQDGKDFATSLRRPPSISIRSSIDRRLLFHMIDSSSAPHWLDQPALFDTPATGHARNKTAALECSEEVFLILE